MYTLSGIFLLLHKKESAPVSTSNYMFGRKFSLVKTVASVVYLVSANKIVDIVIFWQL
jgi:hypothetical protein